MVLKYNEYINESAFWDYIKNSFRKEDNPNKVAEDVFEKIKADIRKNVEVLTTVEQEEEGVLQITLSSKLNIRIVLIYDEFGKPEEGIMLLKSPKRKKEDIKLNIDFSRAERYIDYIKKKEEKNHNKAIKARQAKEAKDRIKDL